MEKCGFLQLKTVEAAGFRSAASPSWQLCYSSNRVLKIQLYQLHPMLCYSVWLKYTHNFRFTSAKAQQIKFVLEYCFVRSKGRAEREKGRKKINWQPEKYSGKTKVPEIADRKRDKLCLQQSCLIRTNTSCRHPSLHPNHNSFDFIISKAAATYIMLHKA